MSGPCRTWAVAALLCCPAGGQGVEWRPYPAPGPVYYYPAPPMWGPVYPAVPYRPRVIYSRPPAAVSGPSAAAVSPSRPYAAPTAAPASAALAPAAASTCSAEPPLQAPPAVTESRTPARPTFNTYFAAPRPSDKPPGDRIPVGFWNLSAGDLTVKVNGQKHVLRRGQKLQLELSRQFVWRVNDREPQAERIPEKESGLEIVIRR